MNVSFMQGFAIADCAARLLAEERPSKGGIPALRREPVAALRTLWQSGERGLRQTVVARVHVWLGHEPGRWQHAYDRAGAAVGKAGR